LRNSVYALTGTIVTSRFLMLRVLWCSFIPMMSVKSLLEWELCGPD
jgi:hypothetical protein